MSEPAPDLYLSPNQQNLLVAALNSNRPSESRKNMSSNIRDSQTPAGLSGSAPNSGHLDYGDDSPFLDSFLDGEGDDSFNFEDQGQMFGDLPDDEDDEATDSYTHLHDKRKSMDGDDEGGGKRREGEDKAAKKPGRKPLTNEPTTKRKAQNRAAQRAFRERKEKHLKDLETKVEDLEKASEARNHENGVLRSQVERLQVELKEYRKRLSWISNNPSARQQNSSISAGSNAFGSSNDFHFQFPKFGDSTFAMLSNSSSTSQQQSQRAVHPTQRTLSMPAQQSASPTTSSVTRHSVSNAMPYTRSPNQVSMSNSPANQITASPRPYGNQMNSVDSLSGLFSPSILEATRNSRNGYFTTENKQIQKPNRTSFDNSYSSVPGLYSGSSVSNTESPGSSAESHPQISSIGTSPEPNFSSPNNQLQDFGLKTINEEANILPTGQWNFNTNITSDFDPSNFSWLAQQHGGSFDPVLFGDYRETQDNILSQDFGSFFNDAYPLPDLGSPSHNYNDLATTTTEQSKKPDLIAKVDAAKEDDITKSDRPQMITCNKIWDRLQSMEKFRNGEIDIDNLCSELRAKAKCSEGGAVVEEKHVNKILGL